jgi:hypothetical protein
MAYFQMDDGFDTESRVMRAGKPAFGLYAACGIWVARQLTDGFIPAEIAALYGTREWIEKLVTTGLWSPVEGGFEMPDYLALHNNPTAETVRKRRADAALRKQKQREKFRKPPNKSQGESRVTGPVTHGGSHGSLSSPPLNRGEEGGAPLREGAPPPSSPTTHTLTSGRVVCAAHQLEIPKSGTCRGCAADFVAADIDEALDRQPPSRDDVRAQLAASRGMYKPKSKWQGPPPELQPDPQEA